MAIKRFTAIHPVEDNDGTLIEYSDCLRLIAAAIEDKNLTIEREREKATFWYKTALALGCVVLFGLFVI